MSDVGCRVIVAGRVQGVFFRDTCVRVANELGVRGTVRNLRDGTVEVRAEGSREAIDRLVDWCRRGPADAHVAGIDVTAVAPAGAVGFRVTR